MQKLFQTYKKALLVAGTLIVVAILSFALGHRNSAGQPNATLANQQLAKTVKVGPSGISYPSGWQESGSVTAVQQQAGVFSVAEHSGPNAEAIVRSVSYTLPKGFDINDVPAQTVDKLKANLSGFKLVSDKVEKAGSTASVNITYTIAGNPVKEYTEVIVPTPNTTYYMTISSQQADFKKLSSDIVALNNALAAYIAGKT